MTIILPFCPYQRLRLEVNFLTSNFNPLNGIAPMQYPKYCMGSQSPKNHVYILRGAELHCSIGGRGAGEKAPLKF
jgi:hypothetical protein